MMLVYNYLFSAGIQAFPEAAWLVLQSFSANSFGSEQNKLKHKQCIKTFKYLNL